jgi:hypothetical protein
MQTAAGGYIGATAFGGWLGWPEPSRDMESPKRDRAKPSLTKENIAPAELETTEIAAVAVQGRASGPSNGAGAPSPHDLFYLPT